MNASLRSAETLRLVQAELRPEEKLLWSSRRQPSALTLGNFVAVCAGVGAVGFGISWIRAATYGWSVGVGSLGFTVVGLILTVCGVAILGATAWNHLDVGRTIYAVTDTRLIVMRGRRSRTVTSYLPQDVGRVERKDNATHIGSVTFAPIWGTDEDGDVHLRDETGFLEIPDALEVERLVLEFRRSAVGNTPRAE